MSKILYVGPGFWVEVTEVVTQNLAHVLLDLKGLKLQGSIEFNPIQEEGKPETLQVTPVLVIASVVGRLPIDQLSIKISEVMQNYEAFARVVGGAWLDGFLKSD